MRAICCVIAILAAATQGTAQTPPTPSPGQATPTDQAKVFRTSTRLVEVSVVVHDSRGQPVSDLKKEDFIITERGKPQQVVFLSMASADTPAAPAPPLPSNIFSNVVAGRSDVPTSVTVVLLDLLNTSWTDQTHARRALMKFLGQIQPQDRIAIFALGQRRLTLLHDYTTNATSLVERLKKNTGEIASDLAASTLDPDVQSELEALGLESIADANQREADFFTTGRIVNTLATLEAIAQHLSGIPGRKNLIWLSGGFPLTLGFDEGRTTRGSTTFTRETDAAVRALNNSGVAVYPVDARGLMAAGFVRGSSGQAGGGNTISRMMAPIQASINTMRVLADRTGGRAAYNTNDLASAVRRAIDDTRVTYTVGYYSTDETQDGKFRDIKVRVNRPRLDVRHRKGYFALKPPDNTAKTRQEESRAAVWSPLESTAIAMNVRADFIDQPEPNSLNLFVQIPPGGVAFTKEGERWKAEVDIVYVQKDEEGRAHGEGVSDSLSLGLTDANYAQIAKDGLILERRVIRQPAATTIRIVVRDATTGSVGSLTIPFSQVQAQK